MSLKRVVGCVSVALCLFSFSIFDTLHAGRGGGRGNGNDKNKAADDDKIDWHDTLEDALTWAKKNNKPVMLVLRRAANKSDLIQVQKFSTWPVLVEASTDRFAAVKGAPRDAAMQQIAKLAGVKTLPVIIWLDQYGNPIKTQPIPDSVNPLVDVVKSWPALIASVEKMLKDRVVQGEKLANQGQLHEAYTELSALTVYKGPESDAARKVQEKVKAKWVSLAEMSSKQAPGSRERAVIVGGLLRETQGTDFEQEMQRLVSSGEKMLAQTDGPNSAVAAANPNPASTAQPAVPAPAQPLKPAQPQKPAQIAGADDQNDVLDATGNGKALTELSNSKSASPSSAESTTAIQADFLNGSTDSQMKSAAKLLQQGMASYRHAIADSMERGTQRNNLLKLAYENLNESSNTLLAIAAQKPDPKIEKLVQEISMMMYGCMKYQSLD